MRGNGKHRRPGNTPLARGLAVVGITGSAALALPLAGATGAAAEAPQAAPTVRAVQAVQAAPTVRAVQAVQAAHSVAIEKAAASQAVKANGVVRYAVVAGDSLSKIAQKHHVSGGWKKIYRDNRAAVGADPGLIRPGLHLSIDAKGAKGAKAGKAGERPAAVSGSGAGGGSALPAVASRPAAQPAVVQAAAQAPAVSSASSAASAVSYTNDLDGWIRESLAIMARNGIPGTYEGIHRNVMRESSGNPLAVNDWDSNALAGTPSKGLLQVIEPTFQAYHVPGTAFDLFDPVANITAACNYAAARYGSIDNVNGAY
ncbi:LysM peptidoglycan-binding domain-containing protein [Streptomyces showdoensis]|uniref:Peptidoglycan-binding protein n=1 Tax=Streptomyces showdoensis TaxID=68268 RepID=A0A2P2GNV4_STREW|nr:transglycosylase SLT domain-containing protein [Streptomyces showdoensis]KKZ73180.1 peptidoglycan-binding protein [Streptomyces showdoensis]